MRFASILAGAALVVGAIAQGRLAFTQTPSSVTAGGSTTISWAGGDGSPVSILLKKGDPNNLQTVAVLKGETTDTSFTWTPPSSLPNGNDYALAITQGVNTINYSGQFSFSGGSASGSASALVLTGSSTGSAALSSATAAAGNFSSTITSSASLITAASASAGTGVSTSRNTTFSSPTLSGSATGSGSATRSGSATGTGAGSATSAAAAAALGVVPAGILGAVAAALFL